MKIENDKHLDAALKVFKILIVELSEEENNLLAGHAAYNKCSRSSVVRKALNQYFNHTYTDKYSLLV